MEEWLFFYSRKVVEKVKMPLKTQVANKMLQCVVYTDIDLGYQAFCGCSLLKTINLDAKKLTFQMNAFLIVSN